MADNAKLTRAADNIRVLAASMVEKAKSGHPGGAIRQPGSAGDPPAAEILNEKRHLYCCR